jgi:YidC/Oxa1 family membrane protein insertase
MLVAANIFQPLIDVFAAVLKFFHNDIGVSWGLSIVLLTVVVRLCLVPLGMKQFHSMQRMAVHMPEMKKIREKYKDNKERQQQETMKFYKDNKVNPFASCVPLLIQWPFLIGLFWTLRGNLRKDICPRIQHLDQVKYAAQHGITLAKAAGQTFVCGGKDGSSFLFIHDLTAKASGVSVIILLVLYIGTSIGSSMIMMMPGTELNQRRMMLVLPVVFAFITIRFPAGALLYYIIFNLWMVVQQSVFKELIGKQYRLPPGGGEIALGTGSISASPGGGMREIFGLAPKPSSNGDGAMLADPAPASKGERPKPPRRSGATATAEPRPTKTKAAKGSNGNGSNGSGSNGVGTSKGTPPPSPRKKKKRSGRRR